MENQSNKTPTVFIIDTDFHSAEGFFNPPQGPKVPWRPMVLRSQGRGQISNHMDTPNHGAVGPGNSCSAGRRDTHPRWSEKSMQLTSQFLTTFIHFGLEATDI